MKIITLTFTTVLFLVACSEIHIPPVINTPMRSPSSIPLIFSPTPPFVPSAIFTTTGLPSSKTITNFPTDIHPTEIATITPTPGLSLDILNCNTAIDLTHQMGEVTNTYPLIRNNTINELTDVCATLTASDEARVHPDKTRCIPYLPSNYQVTLKLTVDTGYKLDTSIRVDVSSNEGASVSLLRSSCRDVGLLDWASDNIGIIEPIP
jgi:hypothetical protein